MRAVFWISVVTVLYVYVGYPVVLAVWARLRPRPLGAVGIQRLPRVTVIVAARNEGARLAARIENLLSLDYPAALRQIIVVSDGSHDSTAGVLAQHRREVEAYFLPPVGKASALNLGAAAATGDILVFADARQRFAPDALRRLVEPFADPVVGGVSGELMIDADVPSSDGTESPVGEGVGLYWRYEKWLRQQESRIGSTLGATGAIYALRRSEWRPLPAETLLDDVLAPMRVVLAGKRIVFNTEARAYDRSSADADTERRRKVRTLAGNFQLLRLEPALLVPFVNPVWLQFVSHKLGRLLVPYALGTLFVANCALAHVNLFYGLTLTLQVAFYLLAFHGAQLATPAMTMDGTARQGSMKKEWVNAHTD